MPFVKLDCGMLDSTIWIDREAREVFITALLMAEPYGADKPMAQLEVRTLNETGFIVPPGAYGMVYAAGVGIVRRAGMEQEIGLRALERLGGPEADSRNPAWEGRRLVRVNGGYIALNYSDYRDHDYTSAERSRRYRERKALRGVTEPLQTVTTRRDRTPSHRDITHAEAEAEAEAEAGKNTTAWFDALRALYPPRAGAQPWGRAFKAVRARLTQGDTWEQLTAGTERYQRYAHATGKLNTEYVMQAATFFGPDRNYLNTWEIPETKAEARLNGNVDVMRDFIGSVS